jgi:hypothetical protein
MKCYKALALALITYSLSLCSAPITSTLLSYDANNGQLKRSAIALYRNVRGASASIPAALELNYKDDRLPQVILFVDDNRAIIGMIIHSQTSIDGKLVSVINDLIMNPRNKSETVDFLNAFEQQKRDEHYVQINAVTTKDTQDFFKKADFKKLEEGMMAKKISGSLSSNGSSSSKSGLIN